MKKILSFLYIMMAVMAVHSQVVNLKFEGADRTGQDYVRLHHVSVYDHDQLWHQVIYYPDTTLALYNNGSVGIAETNNYSPLRLTQNTPNPFAGTTDVMLSMADEGDATLEIADGNGKIVGMYHMRPYPGVHQFRITLSTAGTYVMTARQNGNTSSIKMVCNGGGSSNSITHVGTIGSDGTFTVYLKNAKSNGSYPFTYGDKMEYIGYAVIDDIERVSEVVTGNQYNSFSYKLNFDVARPEITTLAATDVTAYSATLHGDVTADNNALVTERGFCWTNGMGNPTIADHHMAVGDGMGAFSIGTDDYSPLQPGTAYRVRAYAMNAIGLTYGDVKTFTTDPVLPTVVTFEPTNAGCRTFRAGGQINYNGGANITAKGICWNTLGQPTIADAHTNAGTGISSFTSTATDLQIGTLYYVRAYATNSAGTGYGEEFTVTTDSAVPEVTTLTITLNHLAATISSEVTNEHCLDVTARGICWNTTGTPTITDNHTTNGTGLGTFAGTLENLTDGTTYYARAYATNAAGTSYGAEVNFTAVAMPTVITTPVSNITAITATGGGNVISDGGMAVTTRGICWNTTGNPTIADSHTTAGTGTGSFTNSISGLTHSTSYYVRAYATNSVGTAYGEELFFTTSDTLPTIITSAITSITTTAASCGGNITDDGGASVTARGVCWSTSQNPTINDNHTTDGNGTGNFTSSLAGLTHSITYYVRAYATNSIGTAYGEVLSFTTLDTLPTVITETVTNITSTTATCGGNVTTDGGANVTTRGVCWSVNHNPTISNSHTTDGGGMGNFTSNLTGLNNGTTYYVRAYATNNVGTVYGDEMSFTTLDLPSITTASVTDITATTATSGGNVTSDGGAAVTARGVCWSTSQNPTISGNHTTDGNDIGGFTSNLTGLTMGTTYYVRAYATNSVGTAYGNEVSFTTPTLPTVQTWAVSSIQTIPAHAGGHVPSDGGAEVTAKGVCWSTSHNPTIADDHTIDGSGTDSFESIITTNLVANNTYYLRAYATNSVGTAYGEEVSFMAICGSVTVSINGTTTITLGQSTTLTASGASSYRWNTSATTSSITVSPTTTTAYSVTGTDQYGCTGIASATVTVLTIPTVITNGVSSITPITATCGGNVTSTGSAPVTARGVCWSTSHNPTVNDSHTTNGSGTGSFTSSLTNLTPNTTYYARAYATNSVGTAYGEQQSFTTTTLPPTITTNTISNITISTATCGGNITSAGSAPVTARGVCWGTSQNPTINDDHTTNGTGTGSFTSNITGLTAGTTYYVRAYATNSAGIAYGNEVNFTTLNSGTPQDGLPCPDAATVTDIDNNTYNTVQIGNQCWMRENLRTTKYADGTYIPQGNSPYTTAHWSYPNNDESNKLIYGLLYNLKAIMRTSSASSSNPSGVQGICPTGWHVPSRAEWFQLIDYVSVQDQYLCGNNNTYIAKALASTTGWNSTTNTCGIGNNPSTNNNTGFCVFPAGKCTTYGYQQFGMSAFFGITDNEYEATTNVVHVFFYCHYPNVRSQGLSEIFLSVRCIKD